MNYQPRNILVTGGAGFIGANYVHYLLKHDQQVRIINLDKLTYAAAPEYLQDLPAPDRHIFVQGDICDKSLVQLLLEKYQIDTIAHFAAESHVDRSISSPGEFIQTNIVGTFTLLEAARHYWLENKKWTQQECRFHHISTDEVFGTLSATDPAFDEQNRYQPNSPYSASKAGSDHLVRAYFHTYQLPMTMTNCSNNYGPFQHAEKFIPTIIHACLAQRTIPVYGDGSQIRDWLYVTDHCSAIDQVIRNGRLGETYNIGADNEWTNLEVAKHICRVMDEVHPREQSYENLIQFVTDRPGHDWRYAINAEKIKQELGWQSQENFKSGLIKTVNFYLENK